MGRRSCRMTFTSEIPSGIFSSTQLDVMVMMMMIVMMMMMMKVDDDDYDNEGYLVMNVITCEINIVMKVIRVKK